MSEVGVLAVMAEVIYPMREFRCACGRYLFKAALSPGSMVQIKCRSCGENMTVYIPDEEE